MRQTVPHQRSGEAFLLFSQSYLAQSCPAQLGSPICLPAGQIELFIQSQTPLPLCFPLIALLIPKVGTQICLLVRKSQIRKYLGLILQLQIRKFLRCASPQIPNPQFCKEKGSVSDPDPHWFATNTFFYLRKSSLNLYENILSLYL